MWNKQWGPGTLLFSDNVYDDLDSVPPDVTGNSNSSNTSVLLYSGQFVSSNNEIVSWTGNESGSPTAAACAALISTHGVGAVNVVTGHTYCYKTGGGNIAAIVPTGETVKEGGSVSNVLARVTVWAYGSPAPAPNVSWSTQWGPGSLSLTDNVYDDLDSVPPDVTGNSNSSNTSVLLYSGQFVSSKNEIVSWTGNESGSPTAAACAALISTHGVGAVNVVTGHTYCYKTGGGNIAAIVPTRETVKEGGSVSNVLIQATVWKSSN